MSLIPAFKIGIWNAWIFMSVFLLQMLAIMFVDKRVRKRSHIPIEARLNKLDRYAGIIGNLIWLLALGYSVFLPLQPGTQEGLIEERYCLNKFNNDYQEYINRTPRWIGIPQR